MKYKIKVDGSTIRAVISDGFLGGDIDIGLGPYILIDTALTPEQLLNEYAFIGSSLVHVGYRPYPTAIYDADTSSWKDFRSVEQMKTDLVGYANAKLLMDEVSPFIYGGNTYLGDKDSSRRLAGLVTVAKAAIDSGFSFTKPYPTSDNKLVDLSAEDIVGLEVARVLHVDTAFQVYLAKLSAIESAKTIDELHALNLEDYYVAQ